MSEVTNSITRRTATRFVVQKPLYESPTLANLAEWAKEAGIESLLDYTVSTVREDDPRFLGTLGPIQ